MVAKLHAILRPFLLRRMKSDVEQLLPRKKEIILYATLTEHQRNFQDHLVNKTLENYLCEKVDTGIRSPLISVAILWYQFKRSEGVTCYLTFYDEPLYWCISVWSYFVVFDKLRIHIIAIHWQEFHLIWETYSGKMLFDETNV